jgi:hypothetical protein
MESRAEFLSSGQQVHLNYKGLYGYNNDYTSNQLQVKILSGKVYCFRD